MDVIKFRSTLQRVGEIQKNVLGANPGVDEYAQIGNNETDATMSFTMNIFGYGKIVDFGPENKVEGQEMSVMEFCPTKQFVCEIRQECAWSYTNS